MSNESEPHLRPEGEERRALPVHERELAGEELPAARVVVDAERQRAAGVVDGEAVRALEPHAGSHPHRVALRRGGRGRFRAGGVSQSQQPPRVPRVGVYPAHDDRWWPSVDAIEEGDGFYMLLVINRQAIEMEWLGRSVCRTLPCVWLRDVASRLYECVGRMRRKIL